MDEWNGARERESDKIRRAEKCFMLTKTACR